MRRISGVDGLEPLAAFDEVHQLGLEHVDSVDLTPLGSMPALRTLAITSITRSDMGALGAIQQLETLGIFQPIDCSVPSRLALSPSLQQLSLVIDVAGATGAVIQALADAIDWSRLPELQFLTMRVGGLEVLPPAEVDLGFLRELPQLRHLWIQYGIRSRPGTNSPLAPPFAGLPTQLEYLSLAAEDPEALRAALQERVAGRVEVAQQFDLSAVPGPWEIDEVHDGYAAYGSLADLVDGEFETEYDAFRAAERTIRRADAALIARLDFDPESSGTGISTKSRSDLEAALRIIGAIPQSQ